MSVRKRSVRKRILLPTVLWAQSTLLSCVPFSRFALGLPLPFPVLFARSPYAFSIEHRHTFLAPIVYMLAVAYLHILLKFPSFLDSAYLSSCGSVAGSTAFTLSFPLFRPLTHLARRVSFTVSDSHISNPRLTESRACIYGPSPPLYLCAFSPTSHDNLHRRAAVRLSVKPCTFRITPSFSPPSQTRKATRQSPRDPYVPSQA